MIGTAPRSSIYALRVFGATGGAPTSRIIAAIERAIELRELFDAGLPGGQNIKVVNMSLGGSTVAAGRDLMDQAADALLAHDIVAVIAAVERRPVVAHGRQPRQRRRRTHRGSRQPAAQRAHSPARAVRRGGRQPVSSVPRCADGLLQFARSERGWPAGSGCRVERLRQLRAGIWRHGGFHLVRLGHELRGAEHGRHRRRTASPIPGRQRAPDPRRDHRLRESRRARRRLHGASIRATGTSTRVRQRPCSRRAPCRPTRALAHSTRPSR